MKTIDYRRKIILFTWLTGILTGCVHPVAQAALPVEPASTVTQSSNGLTITPTKTYLSTNTPLPTIPATSNPANIIPVITLTPPKETAKVTLTTQPALPTTIDFDPEDWKEWPVIPTVTAHARQIYQEGLQKGTDPHAFSVLGDCQSVPETFWGVYDLNSSVVNGLPDELQETIRQFSSSFSRESPTVKAGTTAGAILWNEWHEGLYTCEVTETPLACELRIHNPSIVLINLGTHYETRNIDYLRKILDILIAQGSLPILSTKADNRELDERLNYEMALLATEYDLPLWNFWKAVSDLPNNGVGVKKGEEFLGEIYLNADGLQRQHFTALQVLNAVWREVR